MIHQIILEGHIYLRHAIRQATHRHHSGYYAGDVDNVAFGLDESWCQQLGELVHSPHVDPEHIVEHLHVCLVQDICGDTDGGVVHEDIQSGISNKLKLDSFKS